MVVHPDAIIHNEETGLICDGNDLNSIYESVLKHLRRMINIKYYGKNAKEFSKQFDWNIVIKKYIEIIKLKILF